MLQPKYFERMSVIVDCSGRGMHGCSTRMFNKVVKTLKTNFPERLYKVFIYNYSPLMEKEWNVLSRKFKFLINLESVSANVIEKMVWVRKGSENVISNYLGKEGLDKKYDGEIEPILGSYWPPRPVNNGNPDCSESAPLIQSYDNYTINGEKFDKEHLFTEALAGYTQKSMTKDFVFKGVGVALLLAIVMGVFAILKHK